jgi:hypothetical protein
MHVISLMFAGWLFAYAVNICHRCITALLGLSLGAPSKGVVV